MPTKRNISKKIIVPGKIRAARNIEVKSIIAGVIEKVFVQVGAHVRKGDPIIQIRTIADPVEFQRLTKRMEAAAAQLENTTKTFNAYKTLFEKQVIARSEYNEVTKQLKIHQAEFQSLKSELSIINGSALNSDGNIIRATADGTILNLPIKIGGSVMARGAFSEGTTIASVGNLDELNFVGTISEIEVANLNENMIINLALVALPKRRITAKITIISPTGTSNDGVTNFEITASLLIPKDLRNTIRDSYSANAEILVDRRIQVLAIEEGNLQFSNDSIFVNVLTDKNVVEKKLVKSGLSDGIYTEIVSGISMKTKIIKPNYNEKQ
nr:efflux RND transporter periplasmic adaptor subunit [Pedobacter sp. MR2016-19]